MRIVGCREIDLAGFPPLKRPLGRHWVVVVEDLTPELAAERSQQEDSEEECERSTRQLYLTLATDPELLSTGGIETFSCPNCGEQVRVELAPPRERAHPGHASCPGCRAHLRLADGGCRWEVAPPGEKRDGRCIFCGAKADSKEHVIPEWISKQLGIREIITMEGSIQSRARRMRRPISFASYRAPIFCRGCNTHFKHLEDAVIPLIVPMANGPTFSIGVRERELLARWSLKTAIALLSAEPGEQDAVPMAHRRALREILADTWVGILHWHGEPVIMSADGVAVNRRRPDLVRVTYGAMLAFEGFGFYVTAFEEIGEGARLTGDRAPMVSIWPPRNGMMAWPLTDNRVLPRTLLGGWTPLQEG